MKVNSNTTGFDLLWVAAGGALGAVLRYGTGHLVPIFTDQTVIFTPTAIENIVGSFAIGLIYTILISRTGNKHQLSLFLLTGLIGSYTTYSGFMVENLMLLQSDPLLFAGYIAFQVFTGVIAAVAGMYMGQKWIQILSKNHMA
jgi:CrcB protein